MKHSNIQQLTETEINLIGGGHDGHHPHPHVFGFHMHELFAVGMALVVLLRAAHQNHPKLAITGGITVAAAIAAGIYHRFHSHPSSTLQEETAASGA